MIQRTITRITQSQSHQGFLGTGHTAAAVLENIPYRQSDPFIVFMDDRLNLPGGDPVGGAHPHAGFETLTLVLKGNSGDWQTGSFELMTAGKGIVHTEEITTAQETHILQVWLALPPDKRWTQPFWQKLQPEAVPTLQNDNYAIRVYSGSSNGLSSPLKNQTPLTVVDFKISNRQTASQELPADHNGLIYVLNGAVQVGGQTIAAGQAGWLDSPSGHAATEVSFTSLAEDTHLVLYAARPHHAEIVTHGPFIGDTLEDISRLYQEYRNGAMPHVHDLGDSQKIVYTTPAT